MFGADAATAAIAAATAAPANGRPAVVNVVGPLGVGKSTLLAELRRSGHHTIDGVDTAARAAAALAAVRQRPGEVTVVAGRVPVLAFRRWSRAARVTTIRLEPWAPERIRALLDDAGVNAAEVDTVVALAGGVPLLGDTLGRALAGGARGEAALADAAAGEILARLRRECAEPWFGPAVTALSVLGTADGDLLAAVGTIANATDFDRLGRASVVRADAAGLRVLDPYRRILDLAWAWRRPLAHRALRRRAAADRRRRLGWAEPPAREALLRHSVFLLGNRTVQDALYRSGGPGVTVRPAGPADADEVVRLVDLWARRGGLDRRRCERLHGAWLDAAPDGFALAIDGDGRPVAMGHAVTLRADLLSHAEPLLQQHTGPLLAADPGAVLIGLAISEDGQRGAHAAILRHVLAAGVGRGRAIVSTPWPPYQKLCAALGFTMHGATRGAVYHRGRPCDVFSQAFTPAAVSAWLDRLGGRPAGAAGLDGATLRAEVGAALRQWDDPAALATSRLGGLPAVEAVGSVEHVLRAGIEAMLAAPDPVEVEAGRVLDAYFLRRAGSHEHIARDLHLSRATYFRRLQAGIAALAAALVD